MSGLYVKDIKEVVDLMCPIKIIINKTVVWDDDHDDLSKYEAVFKIPYIVKKVEFEIISFHHSIVTIKVE